MTAYLHAVGTRATPQSEPIPGTSQVENSAGGFAFPVDDWVRLDRFLILGSQGGSYYATERKLTRENADAVLRCIHADGARTVNRIVEISEAGRAPKNDPALFALAMACGLGDAATKRAALDALPRVARIGTHIQHFAAFAQQFRGWGRALRRGIGRWYNDMPADRLAYQAIKYQARDGWAHRDLLRLGHPKSTDGARNAVYHWLVKGWPEVGEEPHPDATLRLIWAFERAQRATDKAEIVRLIRDYRLPREAVPTQWLTDADVWAALLEDMPMTALIRNLATLTRVGLVAPLSDETRQVVTQLGDTARVRAARVHPMAVLIALKTYAQGHGERSSSAWTPVQPIVDALDAAFYAAFANVEPTGKRWLLGIDVSGSMGWGTIAGAPGLTPRVAAAALALVTAATEPQHVIMGFAEEFRPLNISPRQRLDDVVRIMERTPMGGTDCALPMTWALANRAAADVFVVYTDNEPWAGQVHPSQALRTYRERMGIPARSVVEEFVSNGFTIADPDDAGMLDVVGMDAAVPEVISAFARG